MGNETEACEVGRPARIACRLRLGRKGGAWDACWGRCLYMYVYGGLYDVPRWQALLWFCLTPYGIFQQPLFPSSAVHQPLPMGGVLGFLVLPRIWPL